MIKKYADQFVRGTLGSLIWIMVLTTLFFGTPKVSLNFFWKIIGIAVIVSLVFTVLYPYIWNYSIWSARLNIVVMSLLNFVTGYLSLYLYSIDLFKLMQPYWVMVLLVTFGLHVIIFFFWRRIQNKKIAQDLNDLL